MGLQSCNYRDNKTLFKNMDDTLILTHFGKILAHFYEFWIFRIFFDDGMWTCGIFFLTLAKLTEEHNWLLQTSYMSEKWVYPGAPVIQQYLLVISFFTLQTQVYPIARSNALYIIKGINSYYIYFLLCTSECFMWRYLIQSNSCSINRFLKFFINSLVRYSKIAIYEYTNVNNNHIHTLLLITVIKLNI